MSKVKIYLWLILIVLFTSSCAHLYHETGLISSHRIYGNYCGFTGGHTSKYRAKIELNIKEKEVEEINKWLFSFNKIKQAYATEALIRMNNKGDIELTLNQKRKINRIKNSGRKLNICGGCLYGYESLKDALADFELK